MKNQQKMEDGKAQARPKKKAPNPDFLRSEWARATPFSGSERRNRRRLWGEDNGGGDKILVRLRAPHGTYPLSGAAGLKTLRDHRPPPRSVRTVALIGVPTQVLGSGSRRLDLFCVLCVGLTCFVCANSRSQEASKQFF